MSSVPVRTRVKICGLSREQDVDAAVEAGADAIGLVLYPKSPRYVSAARAAELARRLPPFVTPVLLFVNETLDSVRAACEQVPGATLQFHGDETPAFCRQAAGARPWMRAARIPLDAAQPFDLLKFASDFSEAQALLLDAHVEGYGGAGRTFPWSRLPTSASCHAVLSGGLTPANVADGIVQVRPRFRTLAVDVSSGVEASKGVKDAAKIHQFVAAVRAADEHLARSSHVRLPAA
ncbi:phosphoribosylanthranilate isomerase [Ramlibacter ginsenosidimutans]|uniref:N-(5'-phosphoribosyl)anthranilate isomerase n=1 Tax=Ramlibacter ginsenosidimutans TaxID=502333 RepID=A0A934TWR3_9BURK|nr:phosphoribosylanthranilate isomerase [Ramlibacter ginsenosidimutans]MBK6008047.1 phosphoribosylanthranilate isomerase [Ramlibacter ginsenosidimutans]